MDELIDVAMTNVLKMLRANVKADEALKYSQAAANLSRVLEVYKTHQKTTRKQGTGT